MGISRNEYDEWANLYSDELEQLQRAGFTVEFCDMGGVGFQSFVMIKGPPRPGHEGNRYTVECQTGRELRLFSIGWMSRESHGGPIAPPGEAPELGGDKRP